MAVSPCLKREQLMEPERRGSKSWKCSDTYIGVEWRGGERERKRGGEEWGGREEGIQQGILLDGNQGMTDFGYDKFSRDVCCGSHIQYIRMLQNRGSEIHTYMLGGQEAKYFRISQLISGAVA